MCGFGGNEGAINGLPSVYEAVLRSEKKFDGGSGSAYLWRVSPRQMAYLERLAQEVYSEFPQATWVFALDLLRRQVSGGSRFSNSGIAYTWDRIADLSGAPDRGTRRVFEPLESAELLMVYEHDREESLCRRFMFTDEVVRAFAECGLLDRASGERIAYNAYDRRPTSRRYKTSLLSAPRRTMKEKSLFMHEVLRYWRHATSFFNRAEYLRLLAWQREAAYKARRAALAAPRDTGLQREARRQEGRLASAENALSALEAMGLTPAKEMPAGIYAYHPAYEVQLISGRLSMLGGGIQNAPGLFKGAGYYGLPDVHNYDIASSQTKLLIQEFEDAIAEGAQLDLSVLTGYPGKDVLAERHGVGRELFKRAEHAPKFGAGFHFTSFEAAWERARFEAFYTRVDLGGAVRRPRRAGDLRTDDELIRSRLHTMPLIALEIAEDPAVPEITDPEVAYRLLREIYGPMAAEIARWRSWLITDHWKLHSRSGGAGRFVVNPCGLPFNLLAYEEAERGAKYATCLLQGGEAAFIHHLTLLGLTYGYLVIANDHDGLVTIGVVPEAAVAEARQRSGFRQATLVEKPFKYNPDEHQL